MINMIFLMMIGIVDNFYKYKEVNGLNINYVYDLESILK